MKQFLQKTVREIAVESPATTRVFEEFNIDYCCGGKRLISEACEIAGVDRAVLLARLESVVSGDAAAADLPERKSPSELIDYVVSKHHLFTRTEIERLNGLLEKVCRKHGSQNKELFDLREVFVELGDDMLVHMRKEEDVLFPFIKQLEMAAAGEAQPIRPPFGTVQNPVRMMMLEHDAAAEHLRQMREITTNYTLPAEACPSFRALYFGLQELEKDLHRHVHLENNVLFDQAVDLETKVFGERAAIATAGCDSL